MNVENKRCKTNCEWMIVLNQIGWFIWENICFAWNWPVTYLIARFQDQYVSIFQKSSRILLCLRILAINILTSLRGNTWYKDRGNTRKWIINSKWPLWCVAKRNVVIWESNIFVLVGFFMKGLSQKDQSWLVINFLGVTVRIFSSSFTHSFNIRQMYF